MFPYSFGGKDGPEVSKPGCIKPADDGGIDAGAGGTGCFKPSDGCSPGADDPV